MSLAARSAVMSRIHSKNTGPERSIFRELRRRGVYFSKHAKNLPGRPDICFRRIKLAVFIDGDFWHGWRFPLWRHKLSPNWRDKIESNRKRDRQNVRKLKRLGWKVLRIWEHQLESGPEKCVDRILRFLSVANGEVNVRRCTQKSISHQLEPAQRRALQMGKLRFQST